MIEHPSSGNGLPDEIVNSPLHNDEALVRHLREEARSLGMPFGEDKAVMRAALAPVLPSFHRERAVRLLGPDDPAFCLVRDATNEKSSVSAVNVLASGVSDLLAVLQRLAPAPQEEDA